MLFLCPAAPDLPKFPHGMLTCPMLGSLQSKADPRGKGLVTTAWGREGWGAESWDMDRDHGGEGQQRVPGSNCRVLHPWTGPSLGTQSLFQQQRQTLINPNPLQTHIKHHTSFLVIELSCTKHFIHLKLTIHPHHRLELQSFRRKCQ